MNQLLKLIKNNLRNDLSYFYREKDYKFIIDTLGILVFLASIIAALMYLLLRVDNLNIDIDVFSLVYLFLSLFILADSTKKLAKNIYKRNNNIFLYSLPISKRKIVYANYFIEYLYYLFISFIVYFIAIYAYTRINILDVKQLVNVILCIFLTPIIPSVLGLIFGIIVLAISRRFKFVRIFEIFFNIIILVIISFIGLSFQLINIDILSSFTNLTLIKFFYDIINSNYQTLLIFVSISIICLISVNFISYKDFDIKRKITNKNHLYYQNTITLSLIKKEFLKYISDTSYLKQTISGIMVPLIFLILFILFKDKELWYHQREVPYFLEYFALLCSTVGLYFYQISSSTIYSISYEAKNLWLLFSLPIDQKEVYFSKLVLNYLVVIPFAVVTLCIFLLIVKVNILMSLLILLWVIINCLLGPLFALIINILLPKYNWLKESAIYSGSKSVFVMTFLSILIYGAIAIIISLCYLKVVNPYELINIMNVFAVIILMILINILINLKIKKLDN